MSRRKPRREPKLADSLAEIAAIWGCSAQAVGQWQSQVGFPRNPDGSITIRAVLEWRFRMEGGRLVAGGIDDMDSGDSPALERYRLARARQEEIKLSLMQGEAFPADWVSGLLGETARTIRHAGEQLLRIGDERGSGILNDALDSMVRRVELAMEVANYSTEGLWDDDDAERPETEPAAAGDSRAAGV